jgi:hypothetical protein
MRPGWHHDEVEAEMHEPEQTIEPAGWLLVGGRDQLDTSAMLARHGTVYRWPIAEVDAPRAAAMSPGQPCFLYLTDRSRTVGLWAVGSVVAPVLALPAGTPLLPGEAALEPEPIPAQARLWAEVELLALDKPIPRDTLMARRVLAEGPLESTGSPSLVTLRPAEVSALESFDFWLVDPDEHQRAHLDALLGAEDDLAG